MQYSIVWRYILLQKGKNREELLNEDLIKYSPKKWNINIPFKDYNFRFEDIVPALSGSIGKISLVAAFAVAWASGLNIKDSSFVTENVRLEIIIASLFTIIFCSILNPYAGPPGTLAPLIPIVPLMASMGVHPFILSIVIGLFGLIISYFKYFKILVEINGNGTKSGIILLFGFLGIVSCIDNLRKWANNANINVLFALILITGIVVYVILNRVGARWLIIPVCALTAIVLAAFYGEFPGFQTPIGVPVMNPDEWWNKKWGIGWGINLNNFLKAFPFAMLAVVMWPLDALAVKTLQESNYPAQASKAVFDMNSTYVIVSLRNIIGAIFGGAQTAAIWRSFMIPLATVKRPIGASALLLGIVGVAFGILGFPIDIAVFPPLLWLVLLFGVYIPLVEIGLNMIKTASSAQIASICIIAGIAINPVLGWAICLFIENFGVLKYSADQRMLSIKERLITVCLSAVSIIMLAFLHIL